MMETILIGALVILVECLGELRGLCKELLDDFDVKHILQVVVT